MGFKRRKEKKKSETPAERTAVSLYSVYDEKVTIRQYGAIHTSVFGEMLTSDWL